MDTIEQYTDIFNNVHNMIRQRGYPIDEYTTDVIRSSFKNKEYKNTFKKGDKYTKLAFMFTGKVKPTAVREVLNNILDEIDEEYIDSVVLILNNKVSNAVTRVSNDVKFKNINIQYFSSREVIIDITKHSLNPKFIKINEEEETELMKKYCIDNKLMLPIMLKSDPISKYYNYSTGDICKIIRKSPTNIISISYRFIK